MQQGRAILTVMAALLLGAVSARPAFSHHNAQDKSPGGIGGQVIALRVENEGKREARIDSFGCVVPYTVPGAAEKRLIAAARTVRAEAVHAVPQNTEDSAAVGQFICFFRDAASVRKAVSQMRHVGGISGIIAVQPRVEAQKKYHALLLKDAVSAAGEKARVFEAGSKPQRLRLLTMEERDFRVADCDTINLTLSKTDPVLLPETAVASVTVILRYALSEPLTEREKPKTAAVTRPRNSKG